MASNEFGIRKKIRTKYFFILLLVLYNSLSSSKKVRFSKLPFLHLNIEFPWGHSMICVCSSLFLPNVRIAKYLTRINGLFRKRILSPSISKSFKMRHQLYYHYSLLYLEFRGTHTLVFSRKTIHCL